MVGPVNPVLRFFLLSRRGWGRSKIVPTHDGISATAVSWGTAPTHSHSYASSWKGPRALVALGFVTTVDQSDIRGLVTDMSLIRQGLPLLYKLASVASCDRP